MIFRAVWSRPGAGFVLIAAVALAGASSGCGSSDAGDEAAGPESSACERYASSYCERIAECSPHTLRLLYENLALCTEIVERRCAEDTDIGIFVDDVDGCVAVLANGTCEEVLAAPDAACARTPGARVQGEPCRTGAQCETGVCRFSGNACGACTGLLEEGEPCAGVLDAACGPGLGCDSEGSGECRPIQSRTLEESCDFAVLLCEPDLYCSLIEPKTCKPWLGEGGDCSGDAEACDRRQSLYCNQGVCGPLDVLVEPGMACGANGSPFPRCSEPLFCNPSSQACERRARPGEACVDDPVAGSTCDTYLQCVEGICSNYAEQCL